MLEQMETMVRALQDTLCTALASVDGGQFATDSWQRPGGGGGTSRVLQGGGVFEKAGVGVSRVQGTLSPEAAAAMAGGQGRGEGVDLNFRAVGISLVLHPHNPLAPTVHANYRYFERGRPDAPAQLWWFGGGADLTPSYLFEADVIHFHRLHRDACAKHDPAFYPRFKAWCDRYFYLPHRGETRGVGGIFFDDLCDRPAADLFAFVRDCGAALLPAYLPLVERRHRLPYDDAQRCWQQRRRGRYVEFNLLYDRGTVFGLKTGGRVESILMSLPVTARWDYAPAEPAAGSSEAELLAAVRSPRDWLSAAPPERPDAA